MEVCTRQSTGQSIQWFEHVFTVNNTKLTGFTYYKHHLFMIEFILSTFRRYLIFTTLYAVENESEKNNKQIVLFKAVAHNILDDFSLT